MNQSALKEEVIAQAEPHVSQALSSIRDTIKGNLEQGFDHFKDPQQEEGSATPETDIKTAQKTADVFYLTDVLEADGSITTLKKQGETGMSDTETKTEAPMPLEASAELPALETPETVAAETPVDMPVEAPAMPASFASTPAADFEIGGGGVTDAVPAPDLASKETMVESAAAFSELADMARQLSSTPPASSSEPVTPENAGGYTVDALMREMLRPMLKEWLDAHLPSLVKWLVTEQIEKMLKDQLGVMPTVAPAPAAPVEAPASQAPVEETAPAEEAATDPTADMDFDTPAA